MGMVVLVYPMLAQPNKMSTSLKKTAPTPRYQAIVDHIRGLIDDGTLKPGDRLLAERDLSESFGVSRISVRKALAVLAGKGLIDVTPRHGAYVREISTEQVQDSFSRLVAKNKQQVKDLYEARQIFEVQIVRLAAQRRTEEDISELERLLKETTQALRSGDNPHQADIDFHIGLTRFADNRFFTELMTILVTGLLDAFDILWSMPQSADRLTLVDRIVADHEQIIAAIIAQDSQSAAEIVTEHIAFSIKTVELLNQTLPSN